MVDTHNVVFDECSALQLPADTPPLASLHVPLLDEDNETPSVLTKVTHMTCNNPVPLPVLAAEVQVCDNSLLATNTPVLDGTGPISVPEQTAMEPDGDNTTDLTTAPHPVVCAEIISTTCSDTVTSKQVECAAISSAKHGGEAAQAWW